MTGRERLLEMNLRLDAMPEGPGADALANEMDPLWHALSGEDQDWLRQELARRLVS